MSVRKSDNQELYAKVEEQNLLRQYDLLLNCIEIGLTKGIEAFDKCTLWSLNAAVVANIAQFGGRYREEPIYVGNHLPPHFKDVANEMDRFFSLIHENWDVLDHPHTTSRVCALEAQLDSPLCGGQRENSQGGLLLPHLHEARKIVGGQEDRARTH